MISRETQLSFNKVVDRTDIAKRASHTLKPEENLTRKRENNLLRWIQHPCISRVLYIGSHKSAIYTCCRATQLSTIRRTRTRRWNLSFSLSGPSFMLLSARCLGLYSDLRCEERITFGSFYSFAREDLNLLVGSALHACIIRNAHSQGSNGGWQRHRTLEDALDSFSCIDRSLLANTYSYC